MSPVKNIILACFLVLACVSASSSKEKKKIDWDKAIIVDVCSQWEFRQKHYPGAVNIPVDEIEGRIKELGKDKEKPIVVYCASGVRAQEAKETLNEKGFSNVRNAGSLEELMKDKNSELKY